MDILSLSVPNTFGEINQIQYQSNTVRNESIKYSTKWIIKEDLYFGSYFRVVTYHFLPRFRNSNFSQRKSPAMLRVYYKLYTFPSKENSNGGRGWVKEVTNPTRMSHGNREPDADESRREYDRAGYQWAWYQWLDQANLVQPLFVSRPNPSSFESWQSRARRGWVMAVTSPSRLCDSKVISRATLEM